MRLFESEAIPEAPWELRWEPGRPLWRDRMMGRYGPILLEDPLRPEPDGWQNRPWDPCGILPERPRRTRESIPELEVLSDIRQMSLAPPSYGRDPAGFSATVGAFADDDAFFGPVATTNKYGVVLVIDVDTAFAQREIPFQFAATPREACIATANLNWLIGLVPSGNWRPPPPDDPQVG